METFFKELGIFGTGLLVWSGLITLTWKADEAIDNDPRRRIADMLRGIGVREDVEGWPETFAHMFDRVFGEKHLSWRCFRRSCVASLLAVAVMSFVWWTVSPDVVEEEWNQLGTELFLKVLFFAGLFNILPDYLSLLETRALLRFMGGPARIAVILTVDVIATGLIFLAGLVGGFWVLSILFDESILVSLAEIFKEIWVHLTFRGADGLLSVFFYSTFFTSVWLWLYALAYGAMLAARKVTVTTW